MNSDRELPIDKPAEQITLGSMLRTGDVVPKVRGILAPADFYLRQHQLVCQAIFDLAAAGKPLDIAAVAMELRDRGQLDELASVEDGIGGADYLTKLYDETPSPWAVDHYAGLVKRKAQARAAISLLHEIEPELWDPQADAGDVLNGLQVRIYDLVCRDGRGGVVTLGDAVGKVLERAERVNRGEEPPGLMTGFAEIDRATGGFGPGNLVTLAADTSTGKTALATSIAENVAGDGGPVLYVTREMEDEELAKRHLQADSGVEGWRIKFARALEPDDWTRLVTSAERLKALPVEIDTRSTTVADVAVHARMLGAKYNRPLALIIVDYLQLMDYASAVANPRAGLAHQVGRFVWQLKGLAMDLGTPILLLSQLNREGVKRQGPPTMHNLRDSGEIENHSNVILLLYRPPDAMPAEDGSLEIWAKVAKARDGFTTAWEGTSDIRLRWYGAITRFEGREQQVPAEAGGVNSDPVTAAP